MPKPIRILMSLLVVASDRSNIGPSKSLGERIQMLRFGDEPNFDIYLVKLPSGEDHACICYLFLIMYQKRIGKCAS